jgi:predicted 3-demethylubiquinone-9 3-methyltransferase (glyoxalase superfamily)
MVMTVEFELDGQRFIGINGGPEFRFDEAVSFEIECETQDEIDSAAGSGTASGSPGRWCPPGWKRCSPIPTPSGPIAR